MASRLPPTFLWLSTGVLLLVYRKDGRFAAVGHVCAIITECLTNFENAINKKNKDVLLLLLTSYSRHSQVTAYDVHVRQGGPFVVHAQVLLAQVEVLLAGVTPHDEHASIQHRCRHSCNYKRRFLHQLLLLNSLSNRVYAVNDFIIVHKADKHRETCGVQDS